MKNSLSFLSVISNFIRFYFAYFIGILKSIYLRRKIIEIFTHP
jgi:hypothetical protein